MLCYTIPYYTKLYFTIGFYKGNIYSGPIDTATRQGPVSYTATPGVRAVVDAARLMSQQDRSKIDLDDFPYRLRKAYDIIFDRIL